MGLWVSGPSADLHCSVWQLTPIERYAMKFLEASLEEVSREELKQAEVSMLGVGACSRKLLIPPRPALCAAH